MQKPFIELTTPVKSNKVVPLESQSEGTHQQPRHGVQGKSANTPSFRIEEEVLDKTLDDVPAEQNIHIKKLVSTLDI